MGRTQSDIVATCTRNAQHASQNSVADTTKPTLTRSSSQNSHDPLNQITTAQATARLTLQERLAAVTRSQIARSPSIRSTTSSSENKWLKSQPQAVEIATRQVGLLEEMLAAETGRRRESNELLPASDIMTQLYQQCRDTQTEHQLKIPNITDTAELALLLGLNDRLLAAIAMYDSLYPAKAEPKLQDISTSTDMPPISDTLDLSGSFEIGDAEDDDDDDVRHMMDAETTINSNEKQANLNAESAHTETEGDEHTDMAELRRVIEVEEGVAFKQAKNTGL
ncbi:uncharacterized protein BYT42DRAFT_417999 [Radiomyces spectabilis]|uniref:uncharacterized protein n=1 Tax=Radiomyces spectabilis TaxID=64574 RepID=UPI00221EA416|nr:uncharacterized protein BYT42DRAFT_417999 [Radiomyces spectabilis]KAI8374743.1 hypothetical protein BYT42DRAFT_417999 [Radiomyces spectabilis]